jgi:hypothetical protein
MSQFKSEEELAAEVARWLNDWGWDVYHEVRVYQGGERADIVAKNGLLLWVIECKRSLGLSVIAQAQQWKFWAHAVSVAVPSSRSSKSRTLAEQICRGLGVGMIYVSPLDSEYEWARGKWGMIPPQLIRKPHPDRLMAALSEGHKRFAPGNAKNGPPLPQGLNGKVLSHEVHQRGHHQGTAIR